MCDHPSISFLNVREEAIRWAEEDEKTLAPHSHIVLSQETASYKQQSSPSLALTMAEIMKTLQGQQKAIEYLQSQPKVVGTLEPDHVSPFPPINVGKYHVSSNKKRKNHPLINTVSGGRGELAGCPNLFVRDCLKKKNLMNVTQLAVTES